MIRPCVDSSTAVREYREFMGEVHTNRKLQAHTDSQPFCSSTSQPTATSVEPYSVIHTLALDISASNLKS